jgi:tetratricopeptide (TPR) repeat protein/DNA-binding XRE family transcriptional regulator
MAPSRNRIAYYRDRCIPPLTQRALARLLGVHWNTVVNWERDGVPSAADLLRILEVFVTRRAIRDQAAATQFWAVSARMPIEPPPEVAMLFAPTGSPSERATSTAMTTQAQSAEPSLLPYHRNPLFIGRAAELAALTHNLARCTASAITCIAGVGKTQLACEFAYHARDRFPGGVFWISFANPEAIAAAVARCGWAGHLDIHPRFHHLSLPEQVDLVRAAWRAPVARLLIFDNCEQEALFADWRPAVGGSHILITSRRMHWNPTLGVCPIKLGTLQRDESVRLLGQYTRGQTIAASMLEELAAWVGDLPLALHIIGSRLNQVQNTAQLDSYLTQMRLRTVGLVESPVALYSPTAHTSSLSDTFDASLQLLEEAQLGNRLARIVIDCAACFAAGEMIDQQLLSDAVCAVMAELDVTQLAAALVQAINVALLLDEGDQALKMHRLIVEHVWQRATNVEVIVHAVAQTLLQHARRAFEASDFATLLALYPHLRSVADRATAAADTLGAELHEVVGEWLVHSGAYTAAQASLLRAYAIWQAHGTHLSIDIARCSNLLGLAFQLNGDYAQAARSYEQAYTIWKAALGENHLDTATAANNLGYLLFVRGDQARARAITSKRRSRCAKRTWHQHILMLPAASIISATFAIVRATILGRCHCCIRHSLFERRRMAMHILRQRKA